MHNQKIATQKANCDYLHKYCNDSQKDAVLFNYTGVEIRESKHGYDSLLNKPDC